MSYSTRIMGWWAGQRATLYNCFHGGSGSKLEWLNSREKMSVAFGGEVEHYISQSQLLHIGPSSSDAVLGAWVLPVADVTWATDSWISFSSHYPVLTGFSWEPCPPLPFLHLFFSFSPYFLCFPHTLMCLEKPFQLLLKIFFLCWVLPHSHRN